MTLYAIMRYSAIAFAALILFTSCSTKELNNCDSNDYWCRYLLVEVTIRGVAQDHKIGAYVESMNREGLYIDSLNYWPKDYSGKTVEVTGVVIKRHDLPVFIPEDGKPVVSGIPVPEGTDLHEASKRYLLKDATWKLIE